MVEIVGYTTANNSWEILRNKDIAKHDLLLNIYTHKGECDWDVNFGTTIQDKIFQLKTDSVKQAIADEIKAVVTNNPLLSLYNIQARDIDKGWEFVLSVSYLGQPPEDWLIPVSEDIYNTNYSDGSYSLED